MKCEEIENKIFAYVEGQLSKVEVDKMERHIAQCDHCKTELSKSKELLAAMGAMEPSEPNEKMRYSFEEMLEREKQVLKDRSVSRILPLSWKTAFQIAASVLLLLMGYLYGEQRGHKEAQMQIVHLEEKAKGLKAEMTLAMLDNRSASKRIQAVSYSEQISMPDEKILQAIIGKLHYDDNVNVRLSAAEALSRFQENKLVKNAFVKALEIEKNPDVLIAVIQFLAHTKDKRAVTPMQKLLKEPEVPQYVKSQLNDGLSQLL